MRKLAAAAILLVSAIAASGCARDRTEDAGPMASKTYPVGNFTRLTVAGPYEVTVRTGGSPSVIAKGPQNVLDRTVVEVDGDELEIHPEKSHRWGGIHWRGSDTVRFEITVPSLAATVIAGSGDVRVDKVSGDSFAGKLAGSGSLDLGAVDVGSLELQIAGSGDAKGAGKAREAKYGIAGSGDIDAARLTSETASVKIAGSGGVRAQATRAGKVEIMGSGDVTIAGGAKCEVSKMGSGNVNCS